MHRDHHSWYSHRLSREMGVAVYGHYGMPILAFPTSMGDEHEQEGQGMVRTLSPYIEQGRIRFFSINGVQSDSFNNKERTHSIAAGSRRNTTITSPAKSSPSSTPSCQTPGIPITTYGASLGAYHAANTLFKHPDRVKRCYALSGVYDMRDSMDGMYDDNFYFNNPVDYMANQNDPWFLHQYSRVATSTSRPALAHGKCPVPPTKCPPCLNEPGNCSSSGRLGPERRTRMALLASPDVGIRGRAFLNRSHRLRGPIHRLRGFAQICFRIVEPGLRPACEKHR